MFTIIIILKLSNAIRELNADVSDIIFKMAKDFKFMFHKIKLSTTSVIVNKQSIVFITRSGKH